MGGWLSMDTSQGTCPRLAVAVWTWMQWMSARPYPWTPWTPTHGRDKGGRGGSEGPRGTNPALLFASLVGAERAGRNSVMAAHRIKVHNACVSIRCCFDEECMLLPGGVCTSLPLECSDDSQSCWFPNNTYTLEKVGTTTRVPTLTPPSPISLSQERLCVGHAGAGMGGTPRGSSSSCEQRHTCPTLTC